mmetsp:Transcript_8943/g.20781  ORF Transcript_8943/g.20781 Transcript_8943/m.20781 type:complete len:104 (-) Transcript_8943:79-390(-)
MLACRSRSGGLATAGNGEAGMGKAVKAEEGAEEGAGCGKAKLSWQRCGEMSKFQKDRVNSDFNGGTSGMATRHASPASALGHWLVLWRRLGTVCCELTDWTWQ